ncbi:secretion pathway ATPase [Pseudomonas aeruginosa]|nr:secretion pathway ATPase [Pseudomonas aeruginosa]
MSVFATAAQDRLLDLGDLLRELVAQGRVGQEQAEQCLAIRRSAVRNQQHPLEFLAAQQVEDLKRPRTQARPGDPHPVAGRVRRPALPAHRPAEDRRRRGDSADVLRLRPAPWHPRRRAESGGSHHRQRPALRTGLGKQPGACAQATDQAGGGEPGGHPALHRRVLPPGPLGQRRHLAGPEDQRRRQLRAVAQPRRRRPGAGRPTTRTSSPSSTGCSSTPSSSAPATSTSSRAASRAPCASVSTACCTTSTSSRRR